MGNQCHVVEQLSQAMPSDGVPCHYGPGWDGNKPLLSLWLHSFLACVVLVLPLGMNALIRGGGTDM